MFEPYAQLDEKPVGYGLGLALAQAVVELHGGKIWLEDVIGGGRRVRVSLPGAVRSGGESGGPDTVGAQTTAGMPKRRAG